MSDICIWGVLNTQILSLTSGVLFFWLIFYTSLQRRYSYSKSEIWSCHYPTQKPFILSFKMALRTFLMWTHPYFSSFFCCPNHSLPIPTPSWSSWCNLWSIYPKTIAHSLPKLSVFSFLLFCSYSFFSLRCVFLPSSTVKILLIFSHPVGRWWEKERKVHPFWDSCDCLLSFLSHRSESRLITRLTLIPPSQFTLKVVIYLN